MNTYIPIMILEGWRRFDLIRCWSQFCYFLRRIEYFFMQREFVKLQDLDAPWQNIGVRVFWGRPPLLLIVQLRKPAPVLPGDGVAAFGPPQLALTPLKPFELVCPHLDPCRNPRHHHFWMHFENLHFILHGIFPWKNIPVHFDQSQNTLKWWYRVWGRCWHPLLLCD